MHKGLFVAEVVRLRRLEVFDEHLEIVGEVFRDLVLSGLPDVADGLNQLLIGSLHVPGIRIVDLETHVLDAVLAPELKLELCDKHQGEGQLEEDCLYVLLAQLPHLGLA